MRWAVWLCCAVLIVLGVAPVFMLFFQSARIQGEWSWENYSQTLGNVRIWTLVLNSLMLAGASTLIAALAGVPLAFITVRSTVPHRGIIAAIFCAPLLFPPYVLANGWFQILGRQGLLGRYVGAAASDWLFSLNGGVMVLSTAFLPVVLLLSMAALSTVNPALEDAARTMCSWPRILKEITLPLAAPGIALSVVLTFLLAAGEFAAPSFLRLNVFPVESFTQISAFYNPASATAAWVPMLLLVIASLAVAWKAAGAGDRHFRWNISESNPVSFGSWDRWVSGTALAAAIIMVILPCGALFLNGFSAAAIAEAWTRGSDSLVWSALYAGLAATAITLLGFVLGYASERRVFRGSGVLNPLGLILFAIPGTLLGFAIAIAWNRPFTAWLFGSSFGLVSAFTMQYAAIGQLGFSSGLAQLAPSLEEAAQIAGASWIQRVTTILLPLLRPSCVAVWIVAFVLCLRDTSLALLLSPPGHDTLTARTLTLMANGSQELVSALCLFAIALAVFPASAGLLFLKGRRSS